VATDLLSNYLWVGDVCDAIRTALEKTAQGLIHLGGSQVVDRYEFSLQIARIFGLDAGLLSPASSDSFPGLVARPRNASCTNRRLHDLLGIKPLNIEDGLSAMRHSVLVSSASAAKV
jgi:dTDP-4-dehydrorhamnose reductase